MDSFEVVMLEEMRRVLKGSEIKLSLELNNGASSLKSRKCIASVDAQTVGPSRSWLG